MGLKTITVRGKYFSPAFDFPSRELMIAQIGPFAEWAANCATAVWVIAPVEGTDNSFRLAFAKAADFLAFKASTQLDIGDLLPGAPAMGNLDIQGGYPLVMKTLDDDLGWALRTKLSGFSAQWAAKNARASWCLSPYVDGHLEMTFARKHDLAEFKKTAARFRRELAPLMQTTGMAS